MKWLAQGDINAKCIKILRKWQPLEKSTIVYDEDGYMEDVVGIAKFNNGKVGQRNPKFGFYFNH